MGWRDQGHLEVAASCFLPSLGWQHPISDPIRVQRPQTLSETLSRSSRVGQGTSFQTQFSEQLTERLLPGTRLHPALVQGARRGEQGSGQAGHTAHGRRVWREGGK